MNKAFYLCLITTERSNDLEWGEASMSTNAIGTSIEEDEESENVELENSLYLQAANVIDTSIKEEDEEFENVELGSSLYLQAGNNEVCFTSFQERRKRSYKVISNLCMCNNAVFNPSL